MRALIRLATVLDGFARRIGEWASWLILPLILLVMVDVVTRKIDIIKEWSADITIAYGFSPSFIFQDLEWHVHGMLLLLTFGYAYVMNAHVRVDILREMAKPRRQVMIELIGIVLFAIPFLLVMIYYSYVMAHASFVQGEGSESQVGLGWRFLIKSFMAIGFVVTLAAFLGAMLRCVVYLGGLPHERADAVAGMRFINDPGLPPAPARSPGPAVKREGS